MIRYLRTFLPWIAFAVLSTDTEARWGALAALALSAVLLAGDRRAGRGWDELVLEVGSALFFAALVIASFTISPAPLGAYGPAVSVGWLALISWASLAVRRPFTLGIARQSTPVEVHASPLFYRVNAVITAVWAAAFTLDALALAVLYAVAPHAAVAIVAVKVCAFVIPAIFTLRYPRIVRARYAV
ncbi:hypothetical protein [Microbispora sp. ATCC PTA-5024]|uniref:hypothetical protein n=1 Tax=Microbispora sp. ATCC PTA-5024 TaxID=316330 RepID=UPI00040204F1|nr:hypothetical protein [Microbispora sp. ATCC PTA-5024]